MPTSLDEASVAGCCAATGRGVCEGVQLALWAAGTQDQAALSLCPPPALQPLAPLIQAWRTRCPRGRKGVLSSPAAPLGLGLAPPAAGLAGHCALSLSYITACLSEPKQGWDKLACVLWANPPANILRAGYTQPRKATRTGQAWMRPPKFFSCFSSVCQLVPPSFWPCLFSSSWWKRNDIQGISQGQLLP